MSSTITDSNLKLSLKEEFRHRVARAIKHHGKQAVLLEDGSRFCPHCHFGLPIHVLQVIRTNPIICDNCGTILHTNGGGEQCSTMMA